MIEVEIVERVISRYTNDPEFISIVGDKIREHLHEKEIDASYASGAIASRLSVEIVLAPAGPLAIIGVGTHAVKDVLNSNPFASDREIATKLVSGILHGN